MKMSIKSFINYTTLKLMGILSTMGILNIYLNHIEKKVSGKGISVKLRWKESVDSGFTELCPSTWNKLNEFNIVPVQCNKLLWHYNFTWHSAGQRGACCGPSSLWREKRCLGSLSLGLEISLSVEGKTNWVVWFKFKVMDLVTPFSTHKSIDTQKGFKKPSNDKVINNFTLLSCVVHVVWNVVVWREFSIFWGILWILFWGSESDGMC